MKKAVALILTLVVVFSIYSVCFAESAVEKYTKLLTDYQWTLESYHGTTQKNYFPGFNIQLKTIKLPNRFVFVTGDETGAVYITYYENDYNTTAIGRVTFNNDYTVMMIVADSPFGNTCFIYTR